jgi:hypothetical protein
MMIWNIVLWFTGISLLILGCFTVIVSYRKDWLSKIRWDPSMAGLGSAIVAIGLFFLDKVVGK